MGDGNGIMEGPNFFVLLYNNGKQALEFVPEIHTIDNYIQKAIFNGVIVSKVEGLMGGDIRGQVNR